MLGTKCVEKIQNLPCFYSTRFRSWPEADLFLNQHKHRCAFSGSFTQSTYASCACTLTLQEGVRRTSIKSSMVFRSWPFGPVFSPGGPKRWLHSFSASRIFLTPVWSSLQLHVIALMLHEHTYTKLQQFALLELAECKELESNEHIIP